jgi:hypothetical protein
MGSESHDGAAAEVRRRERDRRSRCTFHGPVEWRKLYKAEVVGAEKVGEEDAYKVMLTPLNGRQTADAWYSKKTGYLLRMERTMVSPMGEITVERR